MDQDKLLRWQRMEESLRMLMAAISLSVLPQELREAEEKLEHREYGIALQVIGALILDNEVRLGPEEKQRMMDLMQEMGMTHPDDEDYWFWEKMQATLQVD